MKYFENFDWVSKILKFIGENDFNKGYAAGICAVLGAVLLILIVKIIFKIIFRRHRCSEVFAHAKDGDVAISVNAIEDTVRAELNAFPSIRVNKIRLYRIRKCYMLNMICEYDGKDGGLPQITQKVKAALYTMFNEFFGIKSIRRINLKFDRLTQDKIITPAPAEEKVVFTPDAEEVKAVSEENEKNNDIF